jgi:hypothetical protein
LGTAKPKLQLRDTGSWSFQVCIPKLELGNEYKSCWAIMEWNQANNYFSLMSAHGLNLLAI